METAGRARESYRDAPSLRASLRALRTHLPALRAAASGLLTIGTQVALLSAVFVLSTRLAGDLRLPVPGNVLGLLLLFALLSTGILKERWIAGAANLLTRHLALFFIPIAVGLMEWTDVLWQAGVRLVLVVVAGTSVGIAVTGAVVQRCGRRRGPHV